MISASKRSQFLAKPTVAPPILITPTKRMCIGPALAAESYLNIRHIIAAAELAGVQAIHPGYGFLAENAHFAEVCRTCNIEFIGPPESAMRALGNKDAARKLAHEAGVPIVPGSDGLITSAAQASAFAASVGLSGPDQGGGRRRRTRHAGGPR